MLFAHLMRIHSSDDYGYEDLVAPLRIHLGRHRSRHPQTSESARPFGVEFFSQEPLEIVGPVRLPYATKRPPKRRPPLYVQDRLDAVDLYQGSFASRSLAKRRSANISICFRSDVLLINVSILFSFAWLPDWQYTGKA